MLYNEDSEFRTSAPAKFKLGFRAKKGICMRNRFKLAVPVDGKILILVLLSAFLVNSSLGQEAGPSTEHVFNLEYKPSGFNLNMSVDIRKDMKFEKEPDFEERNIDRGLLLAGTVEEDYIGFAWDRDEGKLYLDLNRNRDLTDDPCGVFASDNKNLYQNFPNIHLEVVFDSVRLEYEIQMTIYDFGSGRTYCQVYIYSGFQGEIELKGKNWLLKVTDNMDGKITRADKIALTPVESNLGLGFEQLSSSVPETVFFDGHNYGLSFDFQPGETAPSLQVNLAETDSLMGQLKLEGKFIRRLVLEAGSSLVLLDSPEATISIPAGNYHWSSIFLDGGEAGLFQADLNRRRSDDISVSKGESTVLKIGGLLCNSVKIQRTGKVLTLEYELLGIDGYNYTSLRGRVENPPTFAVYNKGKEIAGGKFEYG